MSKQNAGEIIFNEEKRVAPLRVIALQSAAEMGKKIDYYLTLWASQSDNPQDTFLVESQCPRFSSGTARA